MPFVTNQGVRTHYVVDGSGAPVLLVHGFSGNHTSWIGYGFVEPLRARYQLILPDVRAHGQSDGPAAPSAYALETRAADLILILDQLGIERVHYLGYSMGGEIGYVLARDYPQRLCSLVVGGMSPLGEEPPSEPSFLLQLYERAAREGADVLVEGIRNWAGAITPAYEERLRAANIAGGAALLRWRHAHPQDFTQFLSAITTPCLLYCGEADEEYEGMERAVQLLPNARFIGLPGLNHVQVAGASTQLLPELIAFWESVP
jgi:pimeloyl-ACP methyl ester carboxylesterase